MSQSEKFRAFLAEEFKRRQSRAPRYSLRSFARHLGIQPATISQILNGKRKVTFESARVILERLQTSLEIKNALLLSLSDTDQFASPDVEKIEIGDSHRELFSSWETFSLYAAMDVQTEPLTLEKLAEVARVAPAKADRILKEFIELKLATENNGIYTKKNVLLNFAFTMEGGQHQKDLAQKLG